MLGQFLNFYSKYPWVALTIIVQWLATTFIVIYSREADVTIVMGITFFSTVFYAYFGFKVPKS